MPRFVILILSFCLLALPVGCSDDNPVPPPPPEPEPTLPFPDSPDQMMANFQAVYEERNYDWYRDLLHPDFQTILQQETIDQFPDVGPTLDLSEELSIHERMFSGEDLTDPTGAFVPGVANVSFQKFTALDTWKVSPPDDPVANTLFAPYEVEILFSRGQEYSLIRVQGVIRFYAAVQDSLHDGEARPHHRMIGQVDLTGVSWKAVERDNWGGVKALYR